MENKKLKAVFIDIDGVIVGEKIGVNAPLPHHEVCVELNRVHKTVCPVVMCTSRPSFCVPHIAVACGLDGLHITDGGAIIKNTLSREVVYKKLVNFNDVSDIMRDMIDAGVYTEVNTTINYFVQKSQVGQITHDHADAFGRLPEQVDDIVDFARHNEIVGVIFVSTNLEMKQNMFRTLYKHCEGANWDFNVTLAPSIPYADFVCITPKGVSKRTTVELMSDEMHVPLGECLGIGDTDGDWKFMDLCGYVATLENGTDMLKRKVMERGANGIIGGHVNANGLVDVLKSFCK